MKSKILSLLLVVAMLMSISVAAFATNTYDQDYTGDMGTNVSYVGGGAEGYTVTVPATLAPGSSGTVTVDGTWASNRVLNVTADDKVILTNSIDNSLTKELIVTFGGISKAGSNTVAIKNTDEGAFSTVSVSEISNALFGTWSGTFYYNVSMQDSAKIISFTIGDTTYQAKSGMTWGAWVDSEYNTINAFIEYNEPTDEHQIIMEDASGNGYVLLKGEAYVENGYGVAGEMILASDTIIPNATDYKWFEFYIAD